MNKEEVINKINEMTVETFFSKTLFVQQKKVIELIEQLDEPEAGHADEAPRYVKNILARLRELPLHDREVWLKAIMGEFEQDFSHAKWREGYEQGKLEGMVEREKVIVPQFVADWIEKIKKELSLREAMSQGYAPHEVDSWLREMDQDGACLNQELFARAWVDGYEVEKEKQYLVKIRATKHYFAKDGNRKIYFSLAYKSCFTKKELEEAGFGWVFSCKGVEVEEVDE